MFDETFAVGENPSADGAAAEAIQGGAAEATQGGAEAEATQDGAEAEATQDAPAEATQDGAAPEVIVDVAAEATGGEAQQPAEATQGGTQPSDEAQGGEQGGGAWLQVAAAKSHLHVQHVPLRQPLIAKHFASRTHHTHKRARAGGWFVAR